MRFFRHVLPQPHKGESHLNGSQRADSQDMVVGEFPVFLAELGAQGARGKSWEMPQDAGWPDGMNINN